MSTANIWASARSDHNEGVNAAMGDGSVRFVADDIDAFVWHAMCTRAGGDVPASFSIHFVSIRISIARRLHRCTAARPRSALSAALALRALQIRHCQACFTSFLHSHRQSFTVSYTVTFSHFLPPIYFLVTAEIYAPEEQFALLGSYRTKKNAERQRRSKFGRGSRLVARTARNAELLATVTFQHGVGGYEGQQDTVIFSLDRDTNFGTEGHISADQQDFNNVRQGLLKFDDIFGNEPGQIPFGATINSATLKVFVQDDSNAAMQMSLYRMLTDWDESIATWNFFGGSTGGIGGVQASEGESSNLPPDAVLLDSKITPNSATAGMFDVTKSLEYWAAGAN